MAKRSSIIKVSLLGDASDLKRAFSEAEGASKGFGAKLQTAMGNIAGWAANAIKVIGGVGLAVGALALKGGIDRALNIENAQAKLGGLGHDAETIETIMDSALKSVKGTAFGLGDAATAAASAVAAGIEPGKDLTRVLSLTGDTATITGRSFGDAGAIINKVLASNRVSMEEVNQLSDAGLPILQLLADQYGVNAQELRDMVSRGEVDSQIFLKALEDNIAGAALDSGETTQGAFANMGAAMSRFGETLIQDVFPLAKEVFGGIGSGFDDMSKRIKPALETFANSEAFENLKRHIENIPEYFGKAIDTFVDLWENTKFLRDAIGNLVAGGVEVVRWAFDINKSLGGIPAIIAAVVAALALMYANPVIAGLALLAVAIGALTSEARDTRTEVQGVARDLEELAGIAERADKIGELFTPEQIDLLREAGVKISDLADGTISYADASAILSSHLESGISLDYDGMKSKDDLLYRLDLLATSTDELARAEKEAQEKQDAFNRSMGISKGAVEGADRALLTHIGITEDSTSATDENAEATDGATQALVDYESQLRAMADPIFGAMDATRKYEEAQKDTTKAIEEFGEGSPEHLQALEDQAQANLDLQGKLVDLRNKGINPTRDDLVKMFEDMGLSRDEAKLLADSITELDGIKIGDKDFTIHVNAPDIKYSQSGQTLIATNAGYRRLAQGGIATGPTAALIGEAGDDEAVIPLNQRGIGILAEAMYEAGKRHTGGRTLAPAVPQTVIEITVNALDPQAAARAVLESLQSYQRSNGPLPLNVRAS